MSNLKLTPQDRQSIDFAEQERLRETEEGKTSHSKVIYDAYSNDVNLNKGMTAGIMADTWNAFTINSKAKGIWVYAQLYTVLFPCCYIDLSPCRQATPPSEIHNMCYTKYQQTSGNNMYYFGGINVGVVPSSMTFIVREAFKVKCVDGGAYSQYQNDANWRVIKVVEEY